MRGFVQVACVLALALGAGLFAFGSYLLPRADFTSPADMVRYLDRQHEGERIGAAVARGFGIAFLTLGGLGLVVPWVNAFVYRQRWQDPVVPPDSGPPAAV